MKLWSRKGEAPLGLGAAGYVAKLYSAHVVSSPQQEEGNTPMTSSTMTSSTVSGPAALKRAHDTSAHQTQPSSIASERAAITRRVATFRAHQAKLEQERTDYYNATQRKIATALSLPVVPVTSPRER